MKISILTATYNRGELLKNLYNSLLKNADYGVDIEWLIMDDGSTDNTKQIVEELQNVSEMCIKYLTQENSGKMQAINKLAETATGELIVDCDSDDYFKDDAFKIVKEIYERYKDEQGIYGFCFLKVDKNGENIGNNFKKPKTTMFDLYFKEGENGEKAIVFKAGIRKKFKHELENGENFITEARMYHKLDEKYKMICSNQPIMVCEYQKDGYTKNLKEQFIKNPYGYYSYFKEILQKDMKKVTFNKRLYAIKHYILFSYLTKQYHIKDIKNLKNKLLYCILFVPGIIKAKLDFKERNVNL